MKVLIGEKEYRIEFQHGWTPAIRDSVTLDDLRVLPRDTMLAWYLEFYREFTDCRISEQRDGEGWVIVATGRAVRFHSDPPNREVARKQALQKALELFTKPDRKLFWDVYLNRKQTAQKAGGR